MKWRDKIIISLLLLVMINLSVNIGRSLWMVHKEQQLFISLKVQVEKVKKEIEITDNSDMVNGTEIGSEAEQDVLPEYEGLFRENADYVGWIFIEDTKIDYPVVQSLEEPEYYLHRNFNRENSYSGTPFIGSGNLEEKEAVVFLYGHHMRNGTMFADLMKYRKKKFWEEHPVISLDTRYEHRRYQIFSAFYANEEEWIRDGEILSLAAGARRGLKAEEMELLVEKGLYDTGVVPEAGDSLLFLVTCSYQETGGRFVVIGRQIQ